MASVLEVRHEFRVMGQEGDTRFQWDSDNEDQVSIAQKAFEEAKKKKMLIYKEDAKGRRGEQIRDFDRYAERIIAVPQPVGG